MAVGDSHLNVVGLFVDEDRLSYYGQDCTRIPAALGKMYGDKVLYLDLSYNDIDTLRGLEMFTKLEELVLDNNKLNDSIVLPHMPNLKTLSLNNNQISKLELLLDMIASRLPSLTYLSLLCNRACSDCFCTTQYDDMDYQRYRYYVLYKLPSLRFLDSRVVSPAERGQADLRGEFSRVHRPPDVSHEQQHGGARPPMKLDILTSHRGAYGKCNYTYTGKNSEGNRFIMNSDL